MNLFKGTHWSLMPNANEIKERMSRNRKGKGIGNTWGFKKGQSSWNKNLPKEKQPRYNKPISDKQRAACRKNGLLSKGRPSWNRDISEWSPRLHGIQSAKALARDEFRCTE